MDKDIHGFLYFTQPGALGVGTLMEEPAILSESPQGPGDTFEFYLKNHNKVVKLNANSTVFVGFVVG